jgi:hypothetical protein
MADLKISALTASTTPLAGTEVLPIVQSSTTKQVSVANLTAGRSVSGTSFVPTGSTVPANGMYLPATNTVGWSLNSVKRMELGPDGNDLFLNFSGATLADAVQLFIGYTGTTSDFYVGAKNSGTLATKLKVAGLGDVTVSTGNLVIGTSGKGIDFSATPGTGTSELLADYEEGTWTPIDASGASLTFTSVEGSYTKVGRLVTCFFALTFPTTASGSSARIGGLPFTVPAGTSGLNDAILTVNTSSLVIQPYATNNATNFGLLLTYTGSGATNVQLSTAVLRGSITYSV